ncbi:MAG TPA: BlaI/MecI/CopY family transcriptional regulator [Acidobacteriota bacterium]|nr:BlaI/MecI/CopY family transcriptional regulator [Acidobacteriota bacterium]
MTEEAQILDQLGSRAKQTLEALYRLGQASAREILEEVEDLPSYSATRSVLRELHKKGLVQRTERGFKYVYSPTVPRKEVSRSVLRSVLDNFFDGSPEKTMEALMDLSRGRKQKLDLERLEELIEKARKEGR